jgi:hypothetical protein
VAWSVYFSHLRRDAARTLNTKDEVGARMKRNILVAVLASLQLGSAFGHGWQEQDRKKSLPEFLRNDPCGDVFGVDSCTSDSYTGKVIEVIDGGRRS